MTKDKAKLALRALLEWTPETRPIPFQARYNPSNEGLAKHHWIVSQDELDEDAEAPFFSEAFLYNLLGKEDARSLLTRVRQLKEALRDNG